MLVTPSAYAHIFLLAGHQYGHQASTGEDNNIMEAGLYNRGTTYQINSSIGGFLPLDSIFLKIETVPVILNQLSE